MPTTALPVYQCLLSFNATIDATHTCIMPTTLPMPAEFQCHATQSDFTRLSSIFIYFLIALHKNGQCTLCITFALHMILSITFDLPYVPVYVAC